MIKKISQLLLGAELTETILIKIYKLGGSKIWTLGYREYRWRDVTNSINSPIVLKKFRNKKMEMNFGKNLDERVVEYPWIFSNLDKIGGKLLDAGSVLNYELILNQEKLKNKEITIFTYYPEAENFIRKRISYVYGDLRQLPFRQDYYDQIICQSTIEHIDMDNSMYGYKLPSPSVRSEKSYEYIKVIYELYRVLKKGGKLLLTFPYGKFENHGFFQQFDQEMTEKIINYLKGRGKLEINYIKYTKQGWSFATKGECQNSFSYNPHTGVGKSDDGAAHSRAVCLIKFIKSNN